MSRSWNPDRVHTGRIIRSRTTLGAAALLVAVVTFAIGGSTVLACHSEITATVTCDRVVTYSAVSWHPGADDGVNNNVKVWYRAAGSSTSVVLTPATPTWNVFRANANPAASYRFTATFVWPASNPASITIFVQEQVRWGAAQHGDLPSSARSVTVSRPAACETTTTTTTTTLPPTTTTLPPTTTTTTTTMPPTTTTTEPATTTTEPATTTTEPATTTTEPATTTTEPETTTTDAATTTTDVASESPTTPAPSVLGTVVAADPTIPVASATLPKTGRDTATGLVLGAITLAVGAAMIVATRRHS